MSAGVFMESHAKMYINTVCIRITVLIHRIPLYIKKNMKGKVLNFHVFLKFTQIPKDVITLNLKA